MKKKTAEIMNNDECPHCGQYDGAIGIYANHATDCPRVDEHEWTWTAPSNDARVTCALLFLKNMSNMRRAFIRHEECGTTCEILAMYGIKCDGAHYTCTPHVDAWY